MAAGVERAGESGLAVVVLKTKVDVGHPRLGWGHEGDEERW